MTTVGDLLVEFTERPRSKDEPPVLTLTERNGFVRQADRFNKRLATEDVSKYKVVRRNDIAFNPYLLWAGAVAQNTIVDEGIISPLYPTFRVREGFDPRYVARLLLTRELISAYDAIAFGSVPRRRRSSVRDFLDLALPPQPPIEEQRRIAVILDQAEAIRIKRRQLLAHLDTLARSIFHSMFGDPVSNPRALVKVATPVAFTDTSRAATKVPQSQFSTHGDIPIIDQGAKPVAGYTDDKGAAYPGDLPVILFGDHTRTLKYVDTPFVLGADGVKVLTPAPPFRPRYLFEALRALDLPAAGYSRHFKFLKEREVLCPPREEQEEFAERIEAITTQVELVKRALASDDELFASLQSRAFRGQL